LAAWATRRQNGFTARNSEYDRNGCGPHRQCCHWRGRFGAQFVKNSKAINKSAAANTAANQQSVALQRDIYGQNQQALSPFMQRGNAAGDQINALLGLGGPAQVPASSPGGPQQLPSAQPQQQVYQNALAEAKPWLTSPNGGPAYMQFQDVANAQAPQQAQTTQAGQNPAQSAMNAFDIFRGSDGYQFRLGQGMNAVNGGYAGAGTLQSGAALKAINEYGQNFASNEFGNYLGYLGNQQGVGLSGASALAGVGQNYANNITDLNSQNANNITNSAVAKANNSNALLGAIGGAAGNILGGISYRPPTNNSGIVPNNGFAGYQFA
jgi:hypothetical protein